MFLHVMTAHRISSLEILATHPTLNCFKKQERINLHITVGEDDSSYQKVAALGVNLCLLMRETIVNWEQMVPGAGAGCR